MFLLACYYISQYRRRGSAELSNFDPLALFFRANSFVTPIRIWGHNCNGAFSSQHSVISQVNLA